MWAIQAKQNLTISVKENIAGGVLLTGGLGFLGAVCLQQLLTQTEVKKVYCLVRPKRSLSAHDRMNKVLCGPLFHELHKQAASGGPNVFSKVHVVEGDLEQPGIGLSAADRQMLVSDVDIIMHSAASLNLDAHIQHVLRANFYGTKQLLDLAAEMPHLRSFVYLSTYYVNCFMPYNTPVPEEVHYPTLQLAGDPTPLGYAYLAEFLLSLPPETAEKEAAGVLSRLNLASTYAFTKLLTEQMVDDPINLPGVSKVIVRPSLISSMLGGPYPGYISGFAGVPGYCLAYGVGLFHDIGSVAFASDAILDLIPVDLTAALVIASAAAAAVHGPYAGNRARVYHSASAASYPEGAPSFFKNLNTFWSANPPPFKLPFANYPVFSGRHQSTEDSVRAGRKKTGAKVWAAARLLHLSGHARKARALVQGFKAFCVQNSLRYARSIVSRVDHARELELSLDPQERANWPCVWEKGPNMNWESYTWTSLAGLRSLALKLPATDIQGVDHQYVHLQGLADPSLMTLWTAGQTAAAAAESSITSLDVSVKLPGLNQTPTAVVVSSDSPTSVASSSLQSVGSVQFGWHEVSSRTSSAHDSEGGLAEDDEGSAYGAVVPYAKPLPQLDGGIALQRTQSCQAVLITAYMQ